ncbi:MULTISPECIES: glycine cleavage system protein GcvH [unclassified Minwuia]|jgi:glycine cleavage system H protein|uniref:glycine cleavage system protein GcvH n=1 Tax=unclassified Minwuia TaxID=2618799 RepID=UPI002478C3A4|nr:MULTISPECIES: glycine cleavage system protein GcvH [unclassified Minwuia]
MSDRKYTKDHEWIEVSGGEATIGISDYAQDQLGDVVYVDLPDVGQQVEKGAEAAVIESVKAASEVYAPASGEVTARNDALDDNPALVNESAESDGWFYRMKLSNMSDLDGLMDAEAYAAFVEALD